MLKLLSKYRKWLVTFSFAYLYLLMVLIVPTNYKANTPGEVNNLNDVYTIEDRDIENNISTVSVYSWNSLTNLQKWLIENNERFEINEKSLVDQSLSNNDLIKQGRISKDSSHQAAIISAYKHASLKDSSINLEYKLESLVVYYSNHPEIAIGDEVFWINNVNINNDNYQTVEDYLSEADAYQANRPNRITGNNNPGLRVLINEEEPKNLLLNQNFFITFYPKYEIVKTVPNITFETRLNNGGPSGGFMQTLAIYTKLLNLKLNANISGTGTIIVDDLNSVGAIGGLTQKYYTVRRKMDYFFVPAVHEGELDGIIKSSDKVKVIYVNDFTEFIESNLEMLVEVDSND